MHEICTIDLDFIRECNFGLHLVNFVLHFVKSRWLSGRRCLGISYVFCLVQNKISSSSTQTTFPNNTLDFYKSGNFFSTSRNIIGFNNEST